MDLKPDAIFRFSHSSVKRRLRVAGHAAELSLVLFTALCVGFKCTVTYSMIYAETETVWLWVNMFKKMNRRETSHVFSPTLSSKNLIFLKEEKDFSRSGEKRNIFMS